MSHSIPNINQQKGVSLLIFAILVLTIAGGAFLLKNNNSSDLGIKSNQLTRQALGEAKLILENYSISFDPTGATNPAIGRLPFPDTSNGGFDGNANCFAGALNNNLLIGRFPWLGTNTPCTNIPINAELRDGGNNHLWYVVSQNMVEHASNTNFGPDFLDPNLATHPGYLTVFDQSGNILSDRVAFIVFSPGNALNSQNRTSSAANNYLDSLNVPGQGNIDNAVNDLRFVKAETTGSFNDQLTFMTIDELMPKLTNRVLTELKSLLIIHQTTVATGDYPLPTILGDLTHTCDQATALPFTGYGFIASSAGGITPCTSFLTVPAYLNSWLDYIVYEPRQDCVNGVTGGCGKAANANALTVNGVSNVDFVLMSTGFHTNGAFDINTDIDDIINRTSDQIYITPTNNQAVTRDQLIFQ